MWLIIDADFDNMTKSQISESYKNLKSKNEAITKFSFEKTA